MIIPRIKKIVVKKEIININYLHKLVAGSMAELATKEESLADGKLSTHQDVVESILSPIAIDQILTEL